MWVGSRPSFACFRLNWWCIEACQIIERFPKASGHKFNPKFNSSLTWAQPSLTICYAVFGDVAQINCWKLLHLRYVWRMLIIFNTYFDPGSMFGHRQSLKLSIWWHETLMLKFSFHSSLSIFQTNWNKTLNLLSNVQYKVSISYSRYSSWWIFIPLGGSGVTFAICNENDKALTRDMKNRNELHAAPALHNEIGEL